MTGLVALKFSDNPELLAFHVLLALTLFASLCQGGEPERRGGLILAAMIVVQIAVSAFVPGQFDSVDFVSLAVDFLGLIGFGWIALHAMRNWSIWAAALQLLAITAHFTRWIDLSLAPHSYAVMKSVPTFLLMFVLFGGVFRYRLRRRRFGVVPDWRGDGVA